MKHKKHSPDQIISKLREADALLNGQAALFGSYGFLLVPLFVQTVARGENKWC